MNVYCKKEKYTKYSKNIEKKKTKSYKIKIERHLKKVRQIENKIYTKQTDGPTDIPQIVYIHIKI